MKNLLANNLKYTKHVPEYEKWNREQQSKNDTAPSSSANLKKKAKTIAEPILLIDSYTHEKAEDSETFYQTYNTELMTITSLLCTLPFAITKSIPFLEKHAKKGNLAEKASNLLKRYQSATIKNIPATKIGAGIALLGAGTLFVKGIKKSIESQLALIRKASFDATQTIANDPKIFAVLTEEQEQQLQAVETHNKQHQTAFVDKLKDKIDVTSSFQAVNEYKKTKPKYLEQKTKYFEEINTIPNKKISKERKIKAKDDKILFHNLLKNVEHDVLEPLRKVETMANIGYSALFAGGFLEYLITDKLVDVLHIKNKPIRAIAKIGIPIFTYLLLNKNISDFENKAILATKYKHLKQFIENPEQYNTQKEEKQSFIDFVKSVAKDMKDYDRFAEKELPKIKEKLEAKKQLKLTPEQEKEAKLLQKNTLMTINTHKERLFENTVGIEAVSEIITNPVDILGAAIGGKIGHTLSKHCNPKLRPLTTLLGTAIGFIPVAIMEAKFTNEQKKAEKISAMLAMKDLENEQKFADYSPNKYETTIQIKNQSDVFNGIETKLV